MDQLPDNHVFESLPRANAAPESTRTSLSLRDWFRAGARIAFFQTVDLRGKAISAMQLAALIAAVLLVEVSLARYEVLGPAQFDARSWLAPWVSAGLFSLLAWWVLEQESVSVSLGAFLGGLYASAIALTFCGSVFAIAVARAGGYAQSVVWQWAVFIAYWSLVAWSLATLYWVCKLLSVSFKGTLLLLAGSLGFSFGANYLYPERPWQVDYSQASADEIPRMQLSQELFESQSQLLQQSLDQLKEQRPGVRDLYAITFAPYASENVFLKETQMVTAVLGDRFDTLDRSVQLTNHHSTTATLAWATPLNLQRAVQAVSQKNG